MIKWDVTTGVLHVITKFVSKALLKAAGAVSFSVGKVNLLAPLKGALTAIGMVFKVASFGFLAAFIVCMVITVFWLISKLIKHKKERKAGAATLAAAPVQVVPQAAPQSTNVTIVSDPTVLEKLDPGFGQRTNE